MAEKTPEQIAEERIEEALRTGATELDLSNCGLTSLPDSIGQLASLQTLELWGNKLTSLPDSIGQLTSLQNLSLYSNQLSSLPDSIGQLANLKQLSLYSNQLTSLPDSIGQLVQLKGLYLERNELTSLPDSIGQLSQLKRLYLASNELTSLPNSVGQLAQLRTLWLASNQLSSLPASLGRLKKLTSLHLEGNPLPDAVMAAWKRGTKELLAYLRSLKEGEPLYEAKMVLVGEGEVGKTCLVAAMKGKKFDPKSPTTHGIQISPLGLPHPQLDKIITLNAWDFGGQPVYRVTHQFFFSRRSLYLLLWSPRMGVEQCDVEGWINRIKLRVGPEARIIIVATHCKSEGRIARIDEKQLKRDYGDVIVDFHEVDSGANVDPNDKDPAGEKVGVEGLKRKIAEAAAELPQMGELFSTKWKAARDEVLALKKPRIAYTQFADICKERELDELDTQTLADLMHDLGHVVYYRDDEVLKDDMVLQPEWLTKAIGFVLEDPETNERRGELEHARLRGIWCDHKVEGRERYEPHLHPFFLRLMEKYDVSYRLEGEEASLVAQLVPSAQPDDLPWDADASAPAGVGQVSLVCQMEAEPTGIVPWMIVRTHHFATDPRRHWQKGMFLEYDDHGEALLELRKGGREFIVTVRADWPNYFMDVIHYTLDRLIKDRWPGLKPAYSAPCPARVDGGPCDGRFELDALRDFMADGDETIRCQRCRGKQDIEQMLMGFKRATDRAWLKERLEEAAAERKQYARKAAADRQRYARKAAAERKVFASYAEQMFLALLRAISTETGECPRLFTLLPEKLSGFNPANIGKTGHRLTLWCEYPGDKHPTCVIGSGKKDAGQGKRGEYLFKGSQEWLVKTAPYAKLVAGLLKAVVPIAGATVKTLVNASLLEDVGPKLDLMEKITTTLLQGDLDTRSAPDDPDQLISEAEGAGLRELHSLLLDLDPQKTWGGLTRVLTPTGDYLWLCPTHYRQYEPGWPKLP